MELHKARAFLAVAEELHFGRAAQRLHMAQPPLSRLIKSLEAELGAELFVRNPRMVALTPVGEALVEPTRDLIMQSERIAQLARRVQRGETGRVRLGFAGSSVHTIVSDVAHRLRAHRPDLSLELYGAQLSQPGLENLRAGRLDAVIGRWDSLPREVDSHVIAHEELLVAVAADHPLSALETVTADDVAGEPWVTLPGGGGTTLSNRMHQLSIRGRFTPRIVETAVDSATQLLLVDAGVGIALTFSSVRENIPVHSVAFRPLVPSLGSVEVRLAWQHGSINPALAGLIEVVRERTIS
ncbi:LysR substrate-binding domain-containing protein [Microbacterium sp. MC2]